MSRFAVPLLVVFVCGVLPSVGVSADGASANLTIERETLLQYYAPSHPRVVEVTAKIKSGQSLLATTKLRDAEARLLRLVQRRQELTRHFGSKHPKVVENAIQIGAIADELAH